MKLYLQFVCVIVAAVVVQAEEVNKAAEQGVHAAETPHQLPANEQPASAEVERDKKFYSWEGADLPAKRKFYSWAGKRAAGDRSPEADASNSDEAREVDEADETGD